MSTGLETKLRIILEEKTNKITPENIKAGVTIFNVEGNLEPQVDLSVCKNLASLILDDTPLIDDPKITVMLDITNAEDITIEGNNLIIGG